MRHVPELSPKDHQRLWAYIAKCGEDDCWEWVKSCLPTGYGQFEIRINGVRYNWAPHILVYRDYYGTHDTNLDVMHSCDNRKCCNPRHLSQGTRKENVQDAIQKGRFHQTQVYKQNKVKELVLAGYTFRMIASILEISPTHACRLAK